MGDACGHGHGTRGTQYIGFFGKRIAEFSHHDIGGTEQIVALFGDMRNGQGFVIAETDQALAQPRFRFVLRQARSPNAGGRQTRRKFVEAVNARDFFDEIDLARDVGAPRRLRAFPRREQRIRRSLVVVHAHGRKSQRGENRFQVLVGNVRAHDAQQFRSRDRNLFRGALSRLDVHNS